MEIDIKHIAKLARLRIEDNEIEEVQLVEAQMAEKAAKAELQEKGGEV